MKEWKRNWLIFFGWLLLFEIIVLLIFIFVFFETNWLLFLFAQLPIHLLAVTCLAFTVAGIDAVKQEEKQNEWYRRVNKMLEEHEKENDNEQN